MNSGWTPPDPRLRILVGVLVLLLVAIGVRTCVGPGPREGRRINEAETLLRDGQSEAARVELQALLEDHPTEAASWLRAGRALRGVGRAEESVLYLTKAAELDSTSSLVRYELAKSLVDAGLLDDAGRTIEALIRIKPDHADGLYLGASIAAAKGDALNAAILFERAQKIGPSNPDRYRHDPHFDSIRNDPAFLGVVYAWRAPNAFRDGGKGRPS